MSIDDAELKHLDYVQDAIGRMSNHSFTIKGWAVTIAAALLALGSQASHPAGLSGIAIGATLVFWGLDSYYLRQERLYRKLYDAVRAGGYGDTLSMSTAAFVDKDNGWGRTFLARQLLALYISLMLAILAATLVA